MAHIAERNATHYAPIAFGAGVTCCPDPRQVVAYLTEVRPHWFFAVPRVWEKLKAAMEIGIAAEPDADRQQAVDVGAGASAGGRSRPSRRAGSSRPSSPPNTPKPRRRCSPSCAQRVGLDQLLIANVGAAPSPRETIEFFLAIGVPLAELWGLSETTGVGACNLPGAIRIGTVGPAAPGVELKLAEDGEVLMRGGAVMPGYRNDPEKTAEAIDSEGWLHTGDVGEFDEDGYLTDRRPQEGADHQLRRQEHVAGQHRVEAQGGEPADRPGLRRRRQPPLQRRADHPRRRLRAGLRPAARDRGHLARRTSPPSRRSGPRSRPRSSAATPASPGSSR